MSSSSQRDRKIEDIQVLRGISIVFVLFQHLAITSFLFSKLHHQVEIPFYLGVQMFFVISGYVVTLALFKDEFRGVRFLIKRAFRLIPVLLIFIAFSYVMVIAVRAVVPSHYDFFPYFAPTDASFFRQAAGILGGYFLLLKEPTSFQNGAMWSLSVEDQFYAAIALVCVIAILIKRITRIPAHWWVGLVSAVLLVTVLWIRVRYFRGRVPFTRVWPNLTTYIFWWHFDFLACGVLLAIFDRALPGKIRGLFKEKGPSLAGWLLMMPLILAAICESPFAAERRHLLGIAMPFALFCFSFLVLLAANDCAFTPTKGPAYRLLAGLGNRSYSIYVFHFPVFVLAWLVTHRLYPAALANTKHAALLQFIIVIPVLMLLVEPIYRYVEMPLTRLGKRLVDHRKSVADAGVPSSESTLTRIAA